MKLVKEHINEKFTSESDPIKDLGIGIIPPNFDPVYILKKQYPGMDLPVGTIFGKIEGWGAFWSLDQNGKLRGNTTWSEDYFTPWVTNFFDKI